MMIGSTPLVAALLAQSVPAPVPGGCTAPASEHVGQPGCFLTGQLAVDSPPATLYWHVLEAGSEAHARAEARRYRWATAASAHGRWWLYVLSPKALKPALPRHHVAGPFQLAAGKPVVARFMESWFPAGMRTRVHSHSGPEAFYVIDGEQCTETPTDRRRIKPGESYIVEGGPHLQAAPKGRLSLVLILTAPDEPWMRLSEGWQGSDYCRT